MLVHSVEKVADAGLSDADRNAFIESFAIHVRCLRDFLWRKDRPQQGPQDALASDFCDAGAWAKARPKLPEALQIEGKRNRIGREIVHLTYHRLDIDAEAKDWNMSELLHVIADALARFSQVADRERLAPDTRAFLASMPERSGASVISDGLPRVTGASQAAEPSSPTRGGTIAFPGYSADDVAHRLSS